MRQRFRLDRPSIQASSKRDARGPHCCRRSSRKPIEIEHRRLIGSKPQRALAAGIDRAGERGLPSSRSSRPSRPVRRDVEPPACCRPRRRDRTEQPDSADRTIGLKPAVDTDIGASQRAPKSVTMNTSRLPVALAETFPTRMAPTLPVRPILPLASVSAATLHADAGLQRRGLLAGGEDGATARPARAQSVPTAPGCR
jgi:hypothetical protein